MFDINKPYIYTATYKLYIRHIYIYIVRKFCRGNKVIERDRGRERARKISSLAFLPKNICERFFLFTFQFSSCVCVCDLSVAMAVACLIRILSLSLIPISSHSTSFEANVYFLFQFFQNCRRNSSSSSSSSLALSTYLLFYHNLYSFVNGK